MQYRKLPRGNESLSVIGIGGEPLAALSEKSLIEMLEFAFENGINTLDMVVAHPRVRDALGKVLAGRREKVFIQGHLCVAFKNGDYARVRDLNNVKTAFEDLLFRLKTDYIDFGMIHYVDLLSDYEAVLDNGIFDYALQLKKQGVIRHIGFSSHNPIVAKRFIDTGEIDSFMFSINPAYDLDGENEDIDFSGYGALNAVDGKGAMPLRESLYRYCENKNVGITVMKAYAGGCLLDAQKSPFEMAMTTSQCIHYCLTRPSVISIMIGLRNIDEIKSALNYFNEPEAEKDYAKIISLSPKYAISGKCVYCGHCRPCVVGIDIPMVNKLLDLATVVDEVPSTVLSHYNLLEKKAGDCTQCGLCENNCPFGVHIRNLMQKAQRVFGTYAR